MIKAENITKLFDGTPALSNISCNVNEGCIYGMVGSNGAGKSTLLRLLSGVYKQDSGTITVDGDEVFENPKAKSKIVYVSDDPYFPAGADLDFLAGTYSSIYPYFSMKRYEELAGLVRLPRKKSISAFSKGMKRQALTILAMAARTKYVFFDETFDGLDPVMRNYIKKLICCDMVDRGATAIITSHSLRELEDTCDVLSLIHKGGIVLESDIETLKTDRFKIQIAFSEDYSEDKFSGLNVVSFSKHGSVANMIVLGDREETVMKLSAMGPVLLDVLPLTLEEVFTYETEALGYTFDLSFEEEKGEEV